MPIFILGGVAIGSLIILFTASILFYADWWMIILFMCMGMLVSHYLRIYYDKYTSSQDNVLKNLLLLEQLNLVAGQLIAQNNERIVQLENERIDSEARFARLVEKFKENLVFCRNSSAAFAKIEEFLSVVNVSLTERDAQLEQLEDALYAVKKSKVHVVRKFPPRGSRPSRTKKNGSKNKKRGRNSRFINRNRR